MYMLKFIDIPSFKFIIGKDFIVQMFRESRKKLPKGHIGKSLENALFSDFFYGHLTLFNLIHKAIETD